MISVLKLSSPSMLKPICVFQDKRGYSDTMDVHVRRECTTHVLVFMKKNEFNGLWNCCFFFFFVCFALVHTSTSIDLLYMHVIEESNSVPGIKDQCWRDIQISHKKRERNHALCHANRNIVALGVSERAPFTSSPLSLVSSKRVTVET